MPDIQRLTSAVQSLETSASRWNRGALWLIAATAIVASLYFIVSWVASQKATALQQAQAALLRIKDEQLATDLKDKDVAISAADQKAADAKATTASLEHDNLQLKTDLQTATAESRGKQAELAKQQINLAAEQQRTAEAQRQAAEAQLALKQHLEEEIARRKPRHLTSEQRTKLIAFLRANVKGDVVVKSQGNDSEADSFGRELASAIREGGWTVFESIDLAIRFRQGLTIGVHSVDSAPPTSIVLVLALRSIGLQVVSGNDPSFIPEKTLFLTVGSKPE